MGFSEPNSKPFQGVDMDDPDRDHVASTSFAVPLYDTIEDDNGLPAYIDESPGSEVQTQLNQTPPLVQEDEFAVFRKIDKHGSTLYRLSDTLTTDPRAFKVSIFSEAAIAPEPVIQIRGHHTEKVKEKDKEITNKVVDFDITISVPETIERNNARNKPPLLLKEYCVLDLYPKERNAYRGGRFRSQGRNLNVAEAPSLPPTLEEWCPSSFLDRGLG